VLTLQHYIGQQGFEYSDNGAKRKRVVSVGVKKKSMLQHLDTLPHCMHYQGFEYSDNTADRKRMGKAGMKEKMVMC
jgi:hypothetical protein